MFRCAGIWPKRSLGVVPALRRAVQNPRPRQPTPQFRKACHRFVQPRTFVVYWTDQNFREHAMIRHIKSGQSAEAKAENSTQVRKTVESILADIAARGEAAVREYSEKFDKWSPASFRLSDSDIAECIRALPQQVVDD